MPEPAPPLQGPIPETADLLFELVQAEGMAREEQDVSREVSTTEALMTDPTTPEGATYWQERHDYEGLLESLRRAHPPHHDIEGCADCRRIRLLAERGV